MDKANRVSWIDEVKGLGMIYVVLGHCYLHGKFTFWFYSFHMALFFFCSGCTFSNKRFFREFVKRRFFSLIIPYFFFSFVISIYNYVMSITHSGSYNLLEAWKNYLIQNRYTHLWFLVCLFFSDIVFWTLTRLLDKVKYKHTHVIYLSSAVLFVLFFFYRQFIGYDLIFNLDLIPLSTAFMMIGYYYKCMNYKIELLNNRIVLITILPIYLVLAYINYYFMNGVDWYDDRFGNPFLFIAVAVMGLIITVKLTRMRTNVFLCALGRNTLVWYGLHRIVIDIVYTIINKLHISYKSGSILEFIFGILITAIALIVLYPVHIVISRYCPVLIGRRRE